MRLDEWLWCLLAFFFVFITSLTRRLWTDHVATSRP
jgi:hypothetical protein